MQSAPYNVTVPFASVNLAAAAIGPAVNFMLTPKSKEKMKIMIPICCLSVLSSIALLAVVILKGGQAYEMAQSLLLLLNNSMPIIYDFETLLALLANVSAIYRKVIYITGGLTAIVHVLLCACVFVPRVDLSSVWIGLLCTTVVVYLILGVVYFGPHFVYSTNGLFFQLTGCVCMLKVLLNGILLGLGCGGKTSFVLSVWISLLISSVLSLRNPAVTGYRRIMAWKILGKNLPVQDPHGSQHSLHPLTHATHRGCSNVQLGSLASI